MALDKDKVKAVFRELRACFKGHFKSANKGYLPGIESMPSALQPVLKPGVQHWRIVPDEKHRAERNEKMLEALPILVENRSEASKSRLSILRYGHFVLDQNWLTGNCGEMAAAACYLVMLRGAGTPWHVNVASPGDHMFCIVTDGMAPTRRMIFDFPSEPAEAWVIDAWANICCRVQDYDDVFAMQMQAWSVKGKCILVAKEDQETTIMVDPGDNSYLERFSFSGLSYVLVKGVLPKTLPRALRERKDAPAPGAAVK